MNIQLQNKSLDYLKFLFLLPRLQTICSCSGLRSTVLRHSSGPWLGSGNEWFQQVPAGFELVQRVEVWLRVLVSPVQMLYFEVWNENFSVNKRNLNLQKTAPGSIVTDQKQI